jgi:two-component system chemotaxis response regulator CheY
MLRKALLVDDSPTIRMVLRAMLQQAGVPEGGIVEASTGESAVTLFRESKPDVVFLDVEMPGLDGEGTAMAMLREHPLAKLVLTTGLERTDPRVRRLVSLGAFDVVEKPLRRDRIEDVLRLVDEHDRQAGRIR